MQSDKSAAQLLRMKSQFNRKSQGSNTKEITEKPPQPIGRLFPGLVVVKCDDHAYVIREPEKIDITVCNSDIANFGHREEKGRKLKEYFELRGQEHKKKQTKNSEIYLRVGQNTKGGQRNETLQ